MVQRLAVIVLSAALSLSACGRDALIYDSAQGVVVPKDFGCIHHVGLEVCYPCMSGNHDIYIGPDPNFNAKINAIRLYGMGGLEWGHSTEKSAGRFDWKHWDSAFAKFRKVGVKSVNYTIYNPPPFYTRHKHDYSNWRGQLPNSQAALNQWLSAITTRYPEIDIIEIANEVFAPTLEKSFWIGTEAELNTLSDWVLDWRRATGWKGKVWSPSVPGFLGNMKNYLAWLKRYPRTAEFDAISAHFYHVTGEHLGKRASKANHWTSLVELRDGLREAGIDKPIVDGEKGFGPGVATPATIFNYGVKAAVEGIQQVCFFHWSSQGKDETNLGQPFRNPEVKKAFEDISALAGKRIIRVEATTPGERWSVTTSEDAPAPAGRGKDGRSNDTK